MPTYRCFDVPCDLGEVALIEAARQVGPSFSYTLHVNEHARVETYNLVRKAQVEDHPFAPYINVIAHQESEIGQWEWWLVNDSTGEAFGSIGA